MCRSIPKGRLSSCKVQLLPELRPPASAIFVIFDACCVQTSKRSQGKQDASASLISSALAAVQALVVTREQAKETSLIRSFNASLASTVLHPLHVS